MKNALRIGVVFIATFFICYFIFAIAKNTVAQGAFRADNPYDLIITNARIIDGRGKDVFYGAIGVRGDKIVRITDKITNREAETIIDASGLTLAPAIIPWPEDMDWIERDLAGAYMRYPEKRLLVKESDNPRWLGRSVAALIAGGEIDEDTINQDYKTRVYIIPELDIPFVEDINSGFYRLSGWRSELLESDTGKIAQGYRAEMIIYEHKKISDIELMTLLQSELYPPALYRIEGTKVFDAWGRELEPKPPAPPIADDDMEQEEVEEK